MNKFACPMNRVVQTDSAPKNARQTVCELCRLFYSKGWLTASGGAISLREGNLVYLAPVGTEDDGGCPLDAFVLDVNGVMKEVHEMQGRPFEHRSLMMMPHLLLGAGMVIHSHSFNSMIVTKFSQSDFMISPDDMADLSCQSGFRKDYRIPIIEDSRDERRLAKSFFCAIREGSESQAVLVRGHGLYVWGENWNETNCRAEFYEFLFEAALRTKKAGR